MKKIKKEIDEISITHSENYEQVNVKVIHTDGSINYVFNYRINEEAKINDFQYIEQFKNGIYKENEDTMYIYSDEDLQFISNFLIKNNYMYNSKENYIVQAWDGNNAYYWDKEIKEAFDLQNVNDWIEEDEENENMIEETKRIEDIEEYNELCDKIYNKYMQDQCIFHDMGKEEYDHLKRFEIAVMFEIEGTFED